MCIRTQGTQARQNPAISDNNSSLLKMAAKESLDMAVNSRIPFGTGYRLTEVQSILVILSIGRNRDASCSSRGQYAKQSYLKCKEIFIRRDYNFLSMQQGSDKQDNEELLHIITYTENATTMKNVLDALIQK